MRCAVQRRGNCLAPPAAVEKASISRALPWPDIHQMFGFTEPAARLMAFRLKVDLISAIICLCNGGVRIGLAVTFPPTELFDFWEFGCAITELRHRNASTAVNAMAFCTLGTLGIERVQRSAHLERGEINHPGAGAVVHAPRPPHRPLPMVAAEHAADGATGV